MPIYEYLCNACGSKKEHLQKIKDTPIPACPTCGSTDYNKLISAARFQLQGNGWYVTDFKNSNTDQSGPKQKATNEKTKQLANTSANAKPKASPTAATD